MATIFRDQLLKEKTAVVTGGASGIGLAIAQCFAAHGAKLLLLGRKLERLEAASRTPEFEGRKVSVAALDVREYAALEQAFARAEQELGLFDIVIAAAAGNFPAPAAGMSANAFKSVVDIDLLGTFNTVRAAYPHLRRPGASLLAISAAQATVPMAFQSHVCAAKAGVEQLMKTLAMEWGKEGVRCNCLTPGPTLDTEGMRRLAPTAEMQEQIRLSIPLGRFGSKQELADLALFLSSDAAAYVTGAAFVCDGGSSLNGARPTLELSRHGT